MGGRLAAAWHQRYDLSSMVVSRYQVFISSTFDDLESERRSLRFALMEEYASVGMEHFPAAPDRGWSVIEARLNEADIYVLVLGHRYGRLFPGEDVSWTEREYLHAFQRRIPILVFAQSEGGDSEATDDANRLVAFKTRLQSEHLYRKWSSTDGLILAVKDSLREELAKRGSSPPEYPSVLAKKRSLLLQSLYEEKRLRLERGEDIAEIQKEIIDAKRLDRNGPLLEAGDSLGDGRYLLRRILGSGGFATVWLAFDLKEKTEIAVRVLHGDLTRNELSRTRFERGVRRMGQLNHPNIVKVLDGPHREDTWHYCVLPYFQGGDLHAGVAQGLLNVRQSLLAVADVADGIGHAHDHGLIHRDVTPWNMLLTVELQGVVTDFDLVHAKDTTGGTRTAAIGRFVYLAPEAAMDATSADEAGDVFGLGMTALYCCLRKDLTPEVWRDPYSIIKDLGESIHLKRVLRRATEWRRSERYQSVREFSQEFRIAMDARSSPQWKFAEKNGEGIRVLVVDDESFIRDILKDFLTMEGYMVDAATTLDEAFELAAATKYHVALVDLKLGSESGLDLLKHLQERYPRTHVVIMTGFGTIETAVACMKAGARDYLLKPFKVEEVVAVTHRWQDE